MSTWNKNDHIEYLLDISDEDILAAMKEIEGYIDITLQDFKELYLFTCNHAIDRLLQSIHAKDIMTKKVIFVTKDAPLKDVASLMAENVISGVPVVNTSNDVVGIISEKDFLSSMGTRETQSFMGVINQCLNNKGCIAVPIREKKAEDIMTAPAITVQENTPVSEIMTLFTETKINRVPVLNHDKHLVGIVSRADVLRTSLPGIKG